MQNGLIDTVTLTFDLLTPQLPQAYHFKYIRRSFPVLSFITLGSFIFDKQTVPNVLPTPTDKRCPEY